MRASAAPVTEETSVDATLPAPNPMLLPGQVSAQTAPVDAERASSLISRIPAVFVGILAVALALGTAAVAKRRRRASEG